jgi:predicted NUDIX family phosphoesterase
VQSGSLHSVDSGTPTHVNRAVHRFDLSRGLNRDRLEELDISWCRNVPLEALGMLADNCVALKKLHIWGCSQITENFLYGHSNDALQILGGKLDTTGPDAAKAVLTAEQ